MVQMNTLIKVGSLAFDVAQDEKIRALATMVHHGGRRRGLWGQPPSTSNKAEAAKAEPQPAEANAPTENSSASKAPGRIRIPFELNPGERLPWQTDGPMFGVPLGKYVKGGNGKKVMHYAGTLGKMLLK